MDPIAQMIATLQADQVATTAAVSADTDAGTALAAAQHAKDVTAGNVSATGSKQNSDLAAGVALLTSTFQVVLATPPVAPAS